MAVRMLLLLLGVLLMAVGSQAQIRNAPKVHPRKEDIPFIKCQVCEHLAKNVWKQARDLLKSSKPSKKITEFDIIELIEKATTSWRDEGNWITKLDLVESGDKLLLKQMDEDGECGVECKTIERAAEAIMGEHDTDLAEALFTGKLNRAQLTNWLCHELSGACKRKPKPLPKGREPGEPFKVREPDAQNVDKMLGEMNDKGLKGSMYSRAEILEKYGMGGDMALDDEDDEDSDDVAGNYVGNVGPRAKKHVAAAAAAAGDLAASALDGGKKAFAKARDLAQGVGQQASEGLNKAVNEAKVMWSNFAKEQRAQGADVPDAEL